MTAVALLAAAAAFSTIAAAAANLWPLVPIGALVLVGCTAYAGRF